MSFERCLHQRGTSIADLHYINSIIMGNFILTFFRILACMYFFLLMFRIDNNNYYSHAIMIDNNLKQFVIYNTIITVLHPLL
jgi:hypothetical protein